jgi:hypothetical protein
MLLAEPAYALINRLTTRWWLVESLSSGEAFVIEGQALCGSSEFHAWGGSRPQ